MDEQMIVEKEAQESLQTTETVAPDPTPSDAPENFDTLDYVKELFLNSLEQKKADKKKIGLMRFCAFCMAVIAIALVVAIFAAGPLVQSVVNDFHAITLKIQEIDVQALSAEASALMANIETTVKSANDTLDALDMDSLNATVKELGETVNSMNIDSLNSAIENLNTVVGNLANFRLFG